MTELGSKAVRFLQNDDARTYPEPPRAAAHVARLPHAPRPHPPPPRP